jgi:hypothetical protein
MRGHRSSRLFPLLLAALLLRTLIPGGFMPSSVNDGFFLALCPDGLLPEIYAALAGDIPLSSDAHPPGHAMTGHAMAGHAMAGHAMAGHHLHASEVTATQNVAHAGHQGHDADHGNNPFNHCEIGDGLATALASDQPPALSVPIAETRFALALRKGDPIANPHLSYQARGPPSFHV